MDNSDALAQVLGTTELLCSILGHLSQADLLRLQRVSQSWRSLIKNAPNLCAATFTGQGPSQHVLSKVPQLNTFVIGRLRWSPSLEMALVNTTQFHSVGTDPTLQAMAYEHASWRDQYLTWPPVAKLSIIHGTISQEEPSLADLVVTSRRSDNQNLAREEEEDGSSESDSETPPYVLYIEDFPHNSGRECRGISVLDMIYGLRLHYLKFEHSLKFFLRPAFETPRGGEILARIKKYPRELMVDVTVLNF
ncbi:uncharacterized protein N7500_009858 [Penicillium coprophilum]|uniref:uncharacterized protein n=1 Tax=Penicillium coprophilum TaxID=36646 RepID=UPI0023A5D598|nr:uncharacterized protein N7500_009858 [Penicillium coprophilum]KAJ5154419.1 hypothetical protein N7500_009858 [Penicillium coprophilum]